MGYQSTKIIELGSCAFRQWKADHSHCKFIHGYRLIAKFWFSAKELDNKNWVVDFGDLDDLKKVLQNQFDHTLCVAQDDPLLKQFEALHEARGCDLRIMPAVGIEKTAEWCFVVADAHIKDRTDNRCCVEKVEVWEHEKNSAIYTVQKSEYCKDKPKHSADQFEFDFKKTDTEVQPLESAPIANTVAAPAPEIQKTVNDTGAVVGNKITTGWGNPFGGTSWGV